MSFLFNNILKDSLNLNDVIAIKDEATGKILNAHIGSLFSQLINLEQLGQSCIEYPETTITECESGDEITLPLQVSAVLLKNEEVICNLISQLNNFNDNCGGNPDISIPVNMIEGDCDNIGLFNENQIVLYVSRKPLELLPNGLVLEEGDVFYTDAELTTVYDGQDNGFLALDIFGNVNSFELNDQGILSGLNQCTIAEFLTLTTSSTENNWTASLNVDNAIIVDWFLSGGITSQTNSNNPTFNLSSNTSIVTMDVNNPKEILTFVMSDKIVDSIDVTKAINLVNLTLVRTDNISTIDVTQNTLLTTLLLEGNNLSSIDISTNLLLEFLSVNSNNISTLDIQTKAQLKTLFCAGNNLSTLNVSNNLLLENLSANNNNLTAIDVSNNVALHTLSVRDNDIASLDISNNPLIDNLKASNTLLSPTNTDTLLTILDANGLNNGILEIRNNRTIASDTALANLQGKGWTVLEI